MKHLISLEQSKKKGTSIFVLVFLIIFIFSQSRAVQASNVEGAVHPGLAFSSISAKPDYEHTQSTWTFKFTNKDTISLKSGYYMIFKALPGDTTLTSDTAAIIKANNKNYNLKISLVNSKASGKKDMILKMTSDFVLAAKTDKQLIIENIRNPKIGFHEFYCNVFSKSNMPIAHAFCSIDIKEVAPKIIIAQNPPDSIVFDDNNESKPFNLSIKYSSSKKLSGRTMISIVDNSGKYIDSTNIGFLVKASDGNLMRVSMLEGNINNNATVFENIIIACSDSVNVSSFKIRIESPSNYRVVAVDSKSISIIGQ